MSYYHVAQICLNGHVITDTYDQNPEFRQNFCNKCGEKTITKCPNCKSNIRGDYEVEGICFIGSTMDTAPAYCYNCGSPYPWTKTALESTQELLALESTLSSDELSYLSENLSSIIVDTPKTKVVATKFKISLSKISSTTASAIKDILVDIASETAKKIIFP